MSKETPGSMFGQMVRDARTRKGWYQADLSNRMTKQRSKSWVSHVEQGKLIPDVAETVELAELLDEDAVAMVAATLMDTYGAPTSETDWMLFAERVLESEQPQQEQPMKVAPMRRLDIEAHAQDWAACLFDLSLGEAVEVEGLFDDDGDLLERIETCRTTRVFMGAHLRAITHPRMVDDVLAPEGKACVTEDGVVRISIRDDVLVAAQRGNGRARFSIAHELGHALLHTDALLRQPGVPVFRDTGVTASEQLPANMKIYESAEWQANVWAGAFLMPRSAISRLAVTCGIEGVPMTIARLVEHFQVSYQAARIRMEGLMADFT